MAKLYFNYGVMGSSKTANALITRFNYETLGQNAILLKPGIDNRSLSGEEIDAMHTVESRVGISSPCMTVDEFKKLSKNEMTKFDCIIVDEAQFLTESDVDWLSDIVDNLNIPVVCYGLKADFSSKLFPGSKRLLEIADSIREIKTVCWCGAKATYNARFDATGKVIKQGEQVVIGANDKYIGLCRKHWKAGQIGKAKLKELGITNDRDS